MATYRRRDEVSLSTDRAFDTEHAAEAPTPLAGIYRCAGCGREEVSRHGVPLPPRDHHRHTRSQGAVRWRLVVWADHRPK
ncbi:MAG: hypothetical protein KA220_02460 [Phenylobacterium sp.]|nr:hypothetical protein [Phenylobacterium sp.]